MDCGASIVTAIVHNFIIISGAPDAHILSIHIAQPHIYEVWVWWIYMKYEPEIWWSYVVVCTFVLPSSYFVFHFSIFCHCHWQTGRLGKGADACPALADRLTSDDHFSVSGCIVMNAWINNGPVYFLFSGTDIDANLGETVNKRLWWWPTHANSTVNGGTRIGTIPCGNRSYSNEKRYYSL